MRILQISNGIYPRGNAGVEIYTDALSSELASFGHEVHVAIPVKQETEPWTQNNYTVHSLPASARRPYGADPFQSEVNRAKASLDELLHQTKPDYIHIQHLIRLGWPLLAHIESLNIPFTVSLPDYWLLCPGIQRLCEGSLRRCTHECLRIPAFHPRVVGGFLGLRKRRKRLIQLLNSITAPLLPLSDATSDIFAKSGVHRHRMIVTPWAVKPVQVREMAHTAGSERTLSVGYIGRVSPEKGVDILLRAFSQIDRNVELKIFGGGPATIKAFTGYQYAPNIKFMGKYDNSLIGSVLSSVDVVVVPSNWDEPYGLVVQEALMARKPVIVAGVAGLAEQIVHGVNGFIFSKGDSSSLTYWLRVVVDNYHEIQQRLSYDFNQRQIEEDGKFFNSLFNSIRADWKSFKKGLIAPIELRLQKQAQLISEITDTDIVEVCSKMHKEVVAPGSVVAEEWNRANPKSDSAILDFYRNTDSYLYDLCVVHETSERKAWRRCALSVLKENKIHRILDYGGGCGIDSVAFAKAGFSCDLYDIGLKNKEFASRWATLNQVQIQVLDKIPDTQQYDAVFSTELLEHVPEPLVEVKTMARCLCPGGLLIVTHSFGLVGDQYPQHLERHRDLEIRFVNEVEAIGFEFERMLAVPGNYFYLFRKSLHVATEKLTTESQVAPSSLGIATK